MEPKNIFITGTTSGFGLLALEMLLDRGHAVAVGIRGGENRLTEITQKHPKLQNYRNASKLFACDLHMDQPQTIPTAVQLIEDRFSGKLDVLINNAGVGLLGPIEMHTETELRHQMEVNFFGPVFLTQKLLPHLRKSRGRVLCVSSIAGRVVFPFYGSYNASKFALEAAFEALKMDMAGAGVQFCLIEPGGFKTDFTKNLTLGEETFAKSSPYLQSATQFKTFIKVKSDAVTGDPKVVARGLVRLSEQRCIPFRKAFGSDAKLMIFLNRILPSWVRMGVLTTFFNRFAFKK